jgi:hypothetical protein
MLCPLSHTPAPFYINNSANAGGRRKNHSFFFFLFCLTHNMQARPEDNYNVQQKKKDLKSHCEAPFGKAQRVHGNIFVLLSGSRKFH